MNPTQADVDHAVAAAKALQTEGRFTKVKQGDERAASYFARMVASRANPNGSRKGWGWLKKTGGGFNVEGYADGAIVFGDDPDDRANVLKIVTQVGSTDPNAIQIGTSVQERRESDIWANPIPLPEAIPAYLGSAPQPIPGPTPAPFPYPDENTTVKAFQERVRKAYSDAGRTFPDPNDADAFRHFCRYGYSCHEMAEPKAADKHIAELRHDLGLPA